MIKTEHIFYINSNTRYARSKGDGVEFEEAIEKLNKLGEGPFLSLHESICMNDYIVGMYPELEKALDFFDKDFLVWVEFSIKSRNGILQIDEIREQPNSNIIKLSKKPKVGRGC